MAIFFGFRRLNIAARDYLQSTGLGQSYRYFTRSSLMLNADFRFLSFPRKCKSIH